MTLHINKERNSYRITGVFAKITVMNDTVAWDISGDWDQYKCIDLDVETLFKCPEVPDPLAD